jgi:hypothetical protein
MSLRPLALQVAVTVFWLHIGSCRPWHHRDVEALHPDDSSMLRLVFGIGICGCGSHWVQGDHIASEPNWSSVKTTLLH